jgi:hypothetical protein
VTIDEVKLLTPDVRVNRGVAIVTPKDGAAVATRYVAIDLKKGDRLLFDNNFNDRWWGDSGWYRGPSYYGGNPLVVGRS